MPAALFFATKPGPTAGRVGSPANPKLRPEVKSSFFPRGKLSDVESKGETAAEALSISYSTLILGVSDATPLS